MAERPTRRVLFHRARAAFWVLASVVVAFAEDLQESVLVVIIASFYANIVGDLGAAEAADDRVILETLAHIRRAQEQHGRRLARIERRQAALGDTP